jgi:hypothetical protein
MIVTLIRHTHWAQRCYTNITHRHAFGRECVEYHTRKSVSAVSAAYISTSCVVRGEWLPIPVSVPTYNECRVRT